MSSINLSSSSPSTISLSRSRLSQSSTTLLHGLHRVSLPSYHPSTFSIKTTGKVKAAVISREDDLLSFTNGNAPLSNGSLIDDRTEEPLEADSVSLGTLAADSASAPANGFVTEDDDFELDLPTPGFSSIPEAIEDIRQGKLVVVVDDEDRENEGDLVMAAQLATPEAMAFIVKHGTGIVCVSMKDDDLERLHLPLMVNQKENEEKLSTAFTVTVDAKHGTTTGVSARDRATTILSLASRDSKPEDFNRPGHIFPLKYREGGVLKRAGHTEASVDLTVLAGLDPVGVLCEIVDDDGSMARLPKLREFAAENNLKVVSIADLIRYRRKRDKLVERASAARIPTMWGPFTAYCYRSILDGIEHIAMVKGEIGDGQDILVRVHSECLTGDIFGSARCDCGNQLALAMQQIEATGRGVLVYLRGHEGRGIGELVLVHCLVPDVPCCLPFLKSLRLVKMGYACLHKILRGCPYLQNLKMCVNEEEHEGEDTTIALPCLRHLSLWDMMRYKSKSGVFVIEAPRLKYLKIIDDVVYDSRRIENMPNLTEAHVDITQGVTHKFLRALVSARRLYLCVSLLSEVGGSSSLKCSKIHPN
ncbi:unnamed protein product [Arabidopsis arenosa]|uniref:GTP cyclohydrolase II domain-containing protein n=1 Tax=Arabidopsis arenosa TaxID=38785 RepID=A0A8S2BA82_ARAAE|nr:unnamed protein product [Arabidopsis arenosa]